MKHLLRARSLIGTTLAVTTVAVAAAGPADAQDSITFGPVTCENGAVYDSVTLPAATARVGLTDDATVGVAMSIWILTPVSATPVYQVPGQGLEQRTLWCTWSSGMGFDFGADLLLSDPARH